MMREFFTHRTSGRIQTKSYGFALKENFCRFLHPFLICRTGFLVILKYSQIQICDIGSLFYDHTTYCLTKRYE
jgi:hypothetical protein